MLPGADRNDTSANLRVVKTGRDLDTINKAVEEGFIAIFRKVEPSANIQTKYTIVRDTATGKFVELGDYRGSLLVETGQMETVIDWTFYYPYKFPNPYAAYLVPADIRTGELVYLEDLIEDREGVAWNQGDRYRMKSCEAVWNGIDLEIQYDPPRDRGVFIG